MASIQIFCWVLCLFFALPSNAQSHDIDRISPKEIVTPSNGQIIQVKPEVQEPSTGYDEVLVHSLNALVFVSDPEDLVPSIEKEINGILFGVLDVPQEEKFLLRLHSFLYEPITLSLIDSINKEIVRHFRENDRLIVDAFAPAGQDIGSGILQLAVIVSRRGEIKVEGANEVTANRLKGLISLEPGDIILGKKLQNDLNVLNRNPFYDVNMILQRGESFGDTDIILEVDERRSFRVYGGLEDNGTSLTGKRRLLSGFNWGNIGKLGQQLNYQYTRSAEGSEISAHSANYNIPLPERLHSVSLFGAYVKSNPESNDINFDLEGENWQFGLRYNLPLKDWQKVKHEMSLGIDLKRSNNDLEFGGLEVFSSFISIFQLALRYNANVRDKWGATSFSGDFYVSPGGLSDDNDDKAFNAARAEATANYVYGRFSLGRVTPLGHNLNWVVDAQFQLASENLLSM